MWDELIAVPEDDVQFQRTSYRIYHYSFMRPSYHDYEINDGCEYDVEIIDAWNMTITHAGRFSGHFHVELPSRQYIAVRMKKV